MGDAVTDSDAPAIDLTADCSKCAALCCILLAFDQSDAFAYSKDAGHPCRNLTWTHQCGIHGGLTDAGFAGCARYECHGAGQRVVQEVFGGQSWRDNPALIAPMETAFRALRRLHEAMVLLRAAADLPLSADRQTERQGLFAGLQSLDCSGAGLPGFDISAHLKPVQDFLSTLRADLGQAVKPRR